MAKAKPLNPKQLRQKSGLNQQKFWAQFRVTQSGGSRYENGRALPGPVQPLLTIAYTASATSTKCASITANGSATNASRKRHKL